MKFKKAYKILKFNCDKGVRRNNGRVGAAEGPDKILVVLKKKNTLLSLQAAGFKNQNLEQYQEAFAQRIAEIKNNNQNIITIGLGGGHEIAYAHYLGLFNSKEYQNQNIGIINIDAHFDLRLKPTRNSGTPFLDIYNLINSRKDHGFNYLVFGIQEQANSPELFETAKKTNTQYVLGKQMLIERHLEQSLELLDKFLNNSNIHKLYLTICLDAFSTAIAPGVSAPQAMGLFPEHVLPLLNKIKKSDKLIAFDIAEYNPKYDRDDQTAHLAADLIAYLTN